MRLWPFTFLFLTACTPSSGDGYYFEKDSKRIAERPIKVVTYQTYDELLASYSTFNGRTLTVKEKLQAFTVINKTCTIHMIDPAVNYQPDFFGHELTHCLYGEFHPSQNNA